MLHLSLTGIEYYSWTSFRSFICTLILFLFIGEASIRDSSFLSFFFYFPSFIVWFSFLLSNFFFGRYPLFNSVYVVGFGKIFFYYLTFLANFLFESFFRLFSLSYFIAWGLSLLMTFFLMTFSPSYYFLVIYFYSFLKALVIIF